MSVCVIPARGGSKRIPRKNLKPFRGQSLIGRALDTATRSNVFDKVYVSTDDAEIASEAVSRGVTVIDRPADLADDVTPTLPVIRHALATIDHAISDSTQVCCLYPTAVFVTHSDLTKSRDLAVLYPDVAVAAVTKYTHPIQRALIKSNDEYLKPAHPRFLSSRTQDLTPSWHDTGQFYWMTARAWTMADSILAEIVPYEIPSWRVQDIDNMDDWYRAEVTHAVLFD